MINVTGKPCPIPVIEAKKALRAAAAGEKVELLVDNDIARQNLQKLAAGTGCGFQYEAAAEGNILVTLIPGEKSGPAADPDREGGGLVVAIGSDAMGRGEDELGRTLIKSYIYALTELDTPPEYLLFFNSGVKLTTAGSNALADLGVLADKGTNISSCGACLNFYGLTEKLAVGSVTNMYAIATTMAQARRVVNL
ncbi:MAG: sulfurtransferase-like selenium metabolism protein YedF [Peptococcaceae bacterium]|jgi:selenium metabolism protein YedF|nr:sulfurtransferase-like selenium metabolism protein YedF [Peptococcaceae bacterium]